MVTIIMYKLDFNESYYAFLLILLIKVVLCRKIHGTKFMNHRSFSHEIWRFAKGVPSPDHGRSMADSAMPKESRVGYLTSVAKASHTSSHSSFEMSKAPPGCNLCAAMAPEVTRVAFREFTSVS